MGADYDGLGHVGRTVQVTVGSTTITISTQRGLPQGGGLSPLLWSLVADSLLS